MNPHYPAVSRRARHRCEYCRAPEIAFNFAFEVEHIEPSSRGGDPGDDNLALSCHSCNLFKSTLDRRPRGGCCAKDRGIVIDPKMLAPRIVARIEQPDDLSGFRVQSFSVRMNSARQITARRQWRMIGFFP